MKKRHIFSIFILIFLVVAAVGVAVNWPVLREELGSYIPFLEKNAGREKEFEQPRDPQVEIYRLSPAPGAADSVSTPQETQPSEDPSSGAQPSEEKNAYYYNQLDEEEKTVYDQILQAVKNREESVQVNATEDAGLDRIYHGLLKDHPELFWIHNRKEVYKTTYSNRNYCLFTPTYLYNAEETQAILSSMEQAYNIVSGMIPAGADSYEIIKTVYTYLIDETDYAVSEDDQSIAGVFWKKQAVCAGYAGAMQYLLERLGVPCIYVDGSVEGRADGHAWIMVQIDGNWYYVDATNGDQPEFLSGDFVQLAEHKTILMDYLCPFPWEYEANYHASTEYDLPDCTATEKNFYVLNQGIFYDYDWQKVYDYCCMRINNNAAVVRFKFRDQAAFDQAVSDWVNGGSIQEIARYYMQRNGLNQVEYHYGVLEDLKTIYFIF